MAWETRREYNARRKALKRALRLERIEARHRARLKRLEEGKQIWLRVLLGIIDVAAGEFLPGRK